MLKNQSLFSWKQELFDFLQKSLTLPLISFCNALLESDIPATFFSNAAGVGSRFVDFFVRGFSCFFFAIVFFLQPYELKKIYYDKKVGYKIKNVKSYLFTTSGS